MEKFAMILDSNLELIKDGNILACYMRYTRISLKQVWEPYQYVLSNINNK
jgi:hypothetical protein